MKPQMVLTKTVRLFALAVIRHSRAFDLGSRL
jgi:hypothetical protein